MQPHSPPITTGIYNHIASRTTIPRKVAMERARQPRKRAPEDTKSEVLIHYQHRPITADHRKPSPALSARGRWTRSQKTRRYQACACLVLSPAATSMTGHAGYARGGFERQYLMVGTSILFFWRYETFTASRFIVEAVYEGRYCKSSRVRRAK